MTKKPVFLFAFANDKGNSLRLEEEERQLRAIFAPLHDQGKIEFHSLGSTTLDDIYYAFNRFHNRIALFHYGGHSDGNFLHLKDTGDRSENLATIMGMSNKLKVVVINGCKNQQQVNDLFEKGVQSVIATNAKIEDNKALVFSNHFYENLVGGKNLREAFETAASRVKNDDPTLNYSYRSIGFDSEDLSDQFEWELRCSNENLSSWTLPIANPPIENPNFTEEVSLVSPEINKALVKLAFEGISQYDTHCKSMLELYEKNPTPRNFANLQKQLIDTYPSSLSIQLRDLFTPEGREKGRERLRELNEAYLTVLRLIVSISLADLWRALMDEKTFQPKNGFIIREEYRSDLKKFFELKTTTSDSFDYGWLLSTIRRILKDNDHAPFISESDILLNSFATYDEAFQAYQYLEQHLRKRLLSKNIDVSEVETLCYTSEEHLGKLLKTCGFLSAYQLVTVKDIDVKLPKRVQNPQFVHKSAILMGHDNQMLMEEPVTRTSFTNNNSVLVTKDIYGDSDQLNLSPFVIDGNAFKLKKEKLPKIYFFKGWADTSVVYELAETLREYFVIDERIDINVYKTSLQNIRDQLKWFRDDLGI